MLPENIPSARKTVTRKDAALVGTQREQIVKKANELLLYETEKRDLNTKSDLGDGKASEKIVKTIYSHFANYKTPIPINHPERSHWVMLPAYNEEGNIQPLLKSFQEIQKQVSHLKIVIVNDGSTDATLEEIRESQGDLDLTILDNGTNQGLGQTFKNGIRHILQHSGENDVLICMDADNSHLPEQIPELIGQIDSGADLSIASRFVKGAKIAGVPKYRQALSYGLSILFRSFSPIKGVKDFSCGFRAYKINLIREADRVFQDELFFLEGFSCMLGFLVRLSQMGAKVREIPLILRYDRKLGQSKMRTMETILASLKILIQERIQDRTWKGRIDEQRNEKKREENGNVNFLRARKSSPPFKRKQKLKSSIPFLPQTPQFESAQPWSSFSLLSSIALPYLNPSPRVTRENSSPEPTSLVFYILQGFLSTSSLDGCSTNFHLENRHSD